MKFETYSQYNPVGVATAESAFLTVWAGLGSWHSDLVLVGGLVPQYLCGDLSAPRTLPRPVTLDADLGISIGASLGQYGSLHMDLKAQGFRLSKNEFGSPRFVKQMNEQSSAPVRAAHFVLGQPAGSESGDLLFQRRQIQQDMVNAARVLHAVLGM